QTDRLRRSIRHHLHLVRTIEGLRRDLSQQQPTRLEAVYHRLEPVDPVRRTAWLFDRNPELLDVTGDDWRVEEEARERERRNAIQGFIQQGAVDQLLRLADHAVEAGAVGYYIGFSDLGDEVVTG